MTSPKLVGQTASVGFQIGVRRTMAISKEEAWSFLMSPEGLKEWIGDLPSLHLVAGHKYVSKEGISGELRVVKPYEQLRMTWQKKNWAKPSTVQIRLLSASSGNTTVSFHQENLHGPDTREEMKMLWEAVLAKLLEKSNPTT